MSLGALRRGRDGARVRRRHDRRTLDEVGGAGRHDDSLAARRALARRRVGSE